MRRRRSTRARTAAAGRGPRRMAGTKARGPTPERSRLARPLRDCVDSVATALPGIAVRERLTGANNSTQYAAQLESVTSNQLAFLHALARRPGPVCVSCRALARSASPSSSPA